MSRSPLTLAAALLAVPVALGVLPGALAAEPPACKPKKYCVPSGPLEPPAEEPAAAAPRVVVADVDSGINPYHEAFRGTNVTPEVLAEFGIDDDNIIDLTSIENVEQDFADVVNGEPYWFRGTNVIGISFDDNEASDDPLFGGPAKTPIFSDEGDEHGTGTAAAVLDANPEAVVVMVEGVAVPEAETFAFTHPAVDIVTTSYGIPGSPPTGEHLTASYEGVVGLGKLHYGASDNSPALSPPDGTSGPWWSIGVAGFHEDTSGGRETLSGNVVDVVSDFTQDLPYCSDCKEGRESVSGTSFATPRSAGTASKVLLEARKAAGHVGGIVDGAMVRGNGIDLTNWELRRAFEEAAEYPAIADYDAESALLDDFGATPVLEPAPYLQTGWGVFSPAVVDEALAQAGVRGEARAPKGGDACAFNTAQFELRKAYWDELALFSDSAGTDEDPYLRC